ncbi:PID-CTERM protein-sorting domain-containing protein [Hymenobacter bucti]|uniref:PID-CTERM protein-sorting domain-containing protein n=1 Tax=Hymenobacter bucti TaxID=1844114 RepID=A0ABW4QZR7_9BACT
MFTSLLFSLRRPALLVGLLLAALVSHAQAPGNGGATGGPPQPQADPTAVPLDGGASLLLVSGVAFGLKKLRARRRAN